MKVGDTVIWTNDKSRYAKYFFGQIGIIESYTAKSEHDGKAHCRIRWIQPVKYFDRYATVSDFGAENFQVSYEKRRSV